MKSRELAQALARELVQVHGYAARTLSPNTYLLGRQDEAVLVVDGDTVAPPQIASLLARLSGSPVGGGIRLVLCTNQAQLPYLTELVDSVGMPLLWPMVINATGVHITYGGIAETHAINQALTACREASTLRPNPFSELASRLTVTTTLLTACCLCFALQLLSGSPDAMPTLVAFGANAPDLVADGQLWRLVSCMFVHGGLVHIAFNMWALWVLGRFFEQLIDLPRFLVVYTVSGVLASAVSAVNHAVPSVGASGAIFGLFGLYTAIAWKPRGLVHPVVARALLRNAMTLFAINLALGLLFPVIDLAAHMGGFAGGLILGLTLPVARANRTTEALIRISCLACAALLAIGFMFTITGGLSHMRGRDLGSPQRMSIPNTTFSLELPAYMQGLVTDGRPGTTFSRPYAGLEITVVDVGESQGSRASLHNSIATLLQPRGTPAPREIQIGHHNWVIEERSLSTHGIDYWVLLYSAVIDARVVLVRIDVLASQRGRYQTALDHAIATLESARVQTREQPAN